MRVKSATRSRKAATVRAAKQNTGHPTTSDMDYSPREHEFMFAMHEFKRASGRQFPTWSEALMVLDGLGYTKTGLSAA